MMNDNSISCYKYYFLIGEKSQKKPQIESTIHFTKISKLYFCHGYSVEKSIRKLNIMKCYHLFIRIKCEKFI